jgi:hypothetical protein
MGPVLAVGLGLHDAGMTLAPATLKRYPSKAARQNGRAFVPTHAPIALGKHCGARRSRIARGNELGRERAQGRGAALPLHTQSRPAIGSCRGEQRCGRTEALFRPSDK